MSGTTEKTAAELRMMERDVLERMAEDDEEFAGVLSVTSALYGLDYENQLIVYAQDPSARELCSVRSWKDRGRPVKDGESPIWLILPTIRYVPNSAIVGRSGDGSVKRDDRRRIRFDRDPVYETGELTVPVYDVSQTNGEPPTSIRSVMKIEEGVRRSGFVIRHVKRGEIPDRGRDGFLEDRMICVAEEIYDDKRRYCGELVRLMVESERREIAAANRSLTDKELSLILALIRDCILRYFFGEAKASATKMLHREFSGLCGERQELLYRLLTRRYREILLWLIGQELDFMGTAIINGLLDTGNVQDMLGGLFRAEAAFPEDSEMRYEIQLLSRQLMGSADGFLSKLYRKRLFEKVIRFSPPVKIRTKWMEEEGGI